MSLRMKKICENFNVNLTKLIFWIFGTRGTIFKNKTEFWSRRNLLLLEINQQAVAAHINKPAAL